MVLDNFPDKAVGCSINSRSEVLCPDGKGDKFVKGVALVGVDPDFHIRSHFLPEPYQPFHSRDSFHQRTVFIFIYALTLFTYSVFFMV